MHTLAKVGWGVALMLASVSVAASDLAILRNGFSIHHERREVLGTVTRLYPTAGSESYVDIPTDQIDHFEKDLTLSLAPEPPLSQEKLGEVISSISGRHHLDPDLVNSVIHAESGFNPHAVSAKGARGLMQLMPQTASQLGVSNAFDPSANVEGGTRYLRELLERYNFDLIKALAAYNAGPQRVEQYHGVPPFYETRSYVAKVVRDFNRKKLAKTSAAARSGPKKTPTQPAKAARHPTDANLGQAASR
jgi:hypothetical protein